MSKLVNIKIYQPKTDTCKTSDWFAIELSSTDDQSIKLKLEAERELHHLKAESAQIDLSNFKSVKLEGHSKKISSLAEQRQFKPRNDSGAKFNFLTLSWFRIRKDDYTIQYKSSDDPTGSIMFYTCPLKKKSKHASGIRPLSFRKQNIQGKIR